MIKRFSVASHSEMAVCLRWSKYKVAVLDDDNVSIHSNLYFCLQNKISIGSYLCSYLCSYVVLHLWNLRKSFNLRAGWLARMSRSYGLRYKASSSGWRTTWSTQDRSSVAGSGSGSPAAWPPQPCQKDERVLKSWWWSGVKSDRSRQALYNVFFKLDPKYNEY